VTSWRQVRVRHVLAAALLMGMSTARTPVRAQTPPPSSSDAVRAHYERATAAYALGNFAEAAVSYEKAFEVRPDPALLYNAAQAHRRAGNRGRAIELYRSFLQVFPRDDNRELAERHLRELERAAVGDAGLRPDGGDAQPAPSAAAPAAGETGLTARVDPPSSVSAPPRRTLSRRAWLWIAGAAAAVVAGTVTAFALTGQRDPQPSWGRVGP
jgi:tetratricopeptide (TPR) repeat protein